MGIQQCVDYAELQADNSENSATNSANSATNSANSAALSQESALISTESANASISSANFKGKYSDLSGELNIPASVSLNDDVWLLDKNLPDVTQSVPSLDNSDWTLITKGTTTISTVEKLRSLSIPISEVWVSGYHTKGDGAFGSNIFEWDATSTETDNGGTIIKLTNITTGRYKLKYDGAVNVKWFGAKGDGVNDDTLPIRNSLTIAKEVYLPGGTFILTDTIVLDKYGQSLIGSGKTYTYLRIDHNNGAGVVLSQSRCSLKDLTITASDSRQSYTNAGTYDLMSDLFGLKIYNDSGYLTSCLIDNVAVHRQPNHGVYMGGEGANTIFTQCESNYNRGHGFVFDDRTLVGGTSSRCGIVNINSCRAIDNGGNGINISQTGQSCYRFNIDNIETINNAWNANITSLYNAEVYLSGENHKIQPSAFADQNSDTKNLMDNGDIRLTKTTNSDGIYIKTNSKNIIIELCRYISVHIGVRTGTYIDFLHIIGAYFDKRKTSSGEINVYIGFEIGNNSKNITIDVPDSNNVSDMIVSELYPSFPLAVNESLDSDYTITITGSFEPIITKSVFLQKGFYRIVTSMTIHNNSDATAYSSSIKIDGTTLPVSAYSSASVGENITLNINYIHENLDDGIVDVVLQVRQGNGSAGTILKKHSTFGNTSIQMEKI